MKFSSRFFPVLILSVFLILIGSGCSNDEDPTEPEATPGCNDSLTADQLMLNFKTILEDGLFDELECLVHEDFRCIVNPGTIDEWADGSRPISLAYFDRDTFLTIHDNIFSEENGVGPTGEIIPPVASINVTVLDMVGVWEAAESMEYFGDFEGAHVARYNTLLHFNNPSFHRYEVDQALGFVVLATEDGFQLLGIYPLDILKSQGTENTSYDLVLSLYR